MALKDLETGQGWNEARGAPRVGKGALTRALDAPSPAPSRSQW